MKDKEKQIEEILEKVGVYNGQDMWQRTYVVNAKDLETELLKYYKPKENHFEVVGEDSVVLSREEVPYGTELHFLYSREHYGKPQPPCIYSTKEWIYNVRYDGKAWFSVAGRGIGYFGEYLHEIGKTVFLNKEEAQRKLQEKSKWQ